MIWASTLQIRKHGYFDDLDFIILFASILPMYAINLGTMSLFADSSPFTFFTMFVSDVLYRFEWMNIIFCFCQKTFARLAISIKKKKTSHLFLVNSTEKQKVGGAMLFSSFFLCEWVCHLFSNSLKSNTQKMRCECWEEKKILGLELPFLWRKEDILGLIILKRYYKINI